MKAEGAKDLLGEGIRPENLTYAIELEVAGTARNSVSVACPESALRTADELKRLVSTALAVPAGGQVGELHPELLRVQVKKLMPKAQLVQQQVQGPDASHARIGTRKVYWGNRGGEAQVYRWESLRPGNRIDGCAILESANTTHLVPEGWTMIMDGYGNARLNRK
jgi:N-methylhydantoinase A/oxoprolinase/acetone carboxylase beta subunit